IFVPPKAFFSLPFPSFYALSLPFFVTYVYGFSVTYLIGIYIERVPLYRRKGFTKGKNSGLFFPFD
ncbi:MAG: hypothetical protein U0I48_00325, partial [Acutalibacteraceae bacterium]|nr:hypothetical protein [Acutalibacteraceae bacterium]